MRRVLIGCFGEVVALGLHEAFAGRRLDVVGSSTAAGTVISEITSVRPDVVVLDLAEPQTVAVATEISSTFPAIKVVLCSADEPTMQIYPPFHYGESYSCDLDLSALVNTLVS